MSYRTMNPATGELVETFPYTTDAEVGAALEGAVRGFARWRKTPPQARAELLTTVAGALEREKRELAQVMALEMGKPLAQGESEAEKCAWVCRYFAEHGEDFLRPRPYTSDGSEAYVRCEPLGPVLAVMPWNFPFWQLFRFAAPGLMAGNVVLLKHASDTPRCAAAIERLFTDAGAPAGVFRNLYLATEQVAEVIAHRAVRGVTLTGSTRAGREVAATAGRYLKPMVMELGGSDPFIVCDDADLDEAIAVAVKSRCINSGQSCISAKRFLVQEGVLERFTAGFVAGMKAQKVGDPMTPGVDVGPLARADLRDGLARQVKKSVEAGAEVLCGGTPSADNVPDAKGSYYPPTVLTNVPHDSPAACEELFGPVAAVFPFAGDQEAIALANGTDYGLGASLWTRNRERAERLIPELECGSVFVNGMVKSDPRLPFGGVKDSGFGRELARVGMLEFVNQKTVWVK